MKLTMAHNVMLRHYGADVFDPAKMRPLTDQKHPKPLGGLWTSPVSAEFGWKQWCEQELYQELSEYFDVIFTGRCLVINTAADLDKLTWKHPFPEVDFQYPCWSELNGHVDAVWVTENGERETRLSPTRSLYGWDCETVLVINPNCLQPAHA